MNNPVFNLRGQPMQAELVVQPQKVELHFRALRFVEGPLAFYDENLVQETLQHCAIRLGSAAPFVRGKEQVYALPLPADETAAQRMIATLQAALQEMTIPQAHADEPIVVMREGFANSANEAGRKL